MISAERLEVQIDGRVLRAKDELHFRKLQVLAKFVNALLETPEAKQVAKVILYGSVARSEAEADSDIDVLMFTIGRPDVLERQARALAWDISLEADEHISVMAFPLNDCNHPTDFFFPSVLRYGKEVFAMSETDIRRNTARNYHMLALDYIKSAEITRASGQIRAAIDTAYNAAELAAKGFLVLEIEAMPTRHGKVIGSFSDIFIMKKQLIPPEWGRALNVLLDRRHKARYVWEAELTDDMATAGITLAHDLTERLRQYLADTIDASEKEDDE
jgi:predicted nucleotidyltransferase/uncharacterized protein (UPF0332 family)